MTIYDKQATVTANQEKPAFEFGLYTFGDTVPNRHGVQVSHKQRLKEIVDAAILADQAGLDIFGIGEHHTLDFAVSSYVVVLAAIAQATKRIRLTSATTVLSTVDPVRLFEDFATLDLLSDGRAEMIAGRGAFVDSFPLFGYNLEDYSQLFSEKLDLLMKLRESERITWNGQFRSAIRDLEITPRPQRELPLWVGVGGTPQSAVNAGRLGLGMALAILGGSPERAQPLVELYRQSGIEAGHDPSKLQVAVTSHGYVAETSQRAKDEFYPHYSSYMGYFLGKRSGGAAPISRSDFEIMVGPAMAIPVGSPQEVVEKILRQYELFGHSRYILQLDIGNMPYAKAAKAIELIADQVTPIVRREIAKQKRTHENELES